MISLYITTNAAQIGCPEFSRNLRHRELTKYQKLKFREFGDITLSELALENRWKLRGIRPEEIETARGRGLQAHSLLEQERWATGFERL